VRCRSSVVVCDPLEFYNPMHDLANAFGHAAARAAAAILRCHVDVFSYPIARPHPGAVAATVSLSPKALDLKRSAARQYVPLAAEVNARKHLLDATTETLYRDGKFAWPEVCPETVGYEVAGSARVQSGLYTELITYADHVAPIARKLLRPTESTAGTP